LTLMIDRTSSLDATKRRTFCVLGAYLGLFLLTGAIAKLGGIGSPEATVPAAATGASTQDGVQLIAEPTEQPQPIFCYAGSTSGPGFVDAINFTKAAPPQDSMTMAVSFRSSFIGSYQVMIGWETDGHHMGSAELRLRKDGNLEYGEFAKGWNSVMVLPTTNFADGAWHTAVVVRNGSSSAYAEDGLLVSLYADGKLAGRGLLPKRSPRYLVPGAKSARPVHQDYVFQGSIRAVKIYDHALTDRQLPRIADDCASASASASSKNLLERVAVKILSSVI